MSITQWQENELFTVRVYKRLTNRPDVLWANSYELSARLGNTDGTTAAKQAATSIALWEANFHLPDVQFDRAVFSTIIPDGVPYQPDSFVSVGLTDILGLRAGAIGDPQPLQVCLMARRVVNFGRNGRLLYRRCLTENDVNAPAGTPALIPAARTALQGLFQGGWDGGAESPPLLELLETVYGLNMVMADISNPETQVRVVEDIDPTGVVIKKYNNAFYNRRTPTAPPVNP